MEMLIVAGFLGSGKTSTILSVVQKIHENDGRRVAIIVNDFGKIGVDGKLMERNGLKVKEFWGGCICCTLGSFLTGTIEKVVEEIEPDYVIIEPSGIADPKMILKTLDKYTGPPFDRIRTIVILDASRFDLYKQVLAIPLQNQIGSAEAIFINKIDEVEPSTVENIKSQVRESGFDKTIIEISATEGWNLDSVYDSLVS
jgi:G3E family GTPase